MPSTHPTSDRAVLDAFLDEHYRCGTVERDGRTIAVWVTHGIAARSSPPTGGQGSGVDLDVMWMARTPNGVEGGRLRAVPGPTLVASVVAEITRADLDAEARAERARDFVRNIRSLPRDRGPGDGGGRRGNWRTVLAMGKSKAAIGWTGSDEPLSSACMVAIARTDAVMAGFMGSLDPKALEFVDGGLSALDTVGLAWGGLDRTFDPEAPLARAISLRPAFARILGSAWIEDPDAVRAALGQGVLDRIIVRRVMAEGLVSPRLLPALAGAERAVVAHGEQPAGLSRSDWQRTNRNGAAVGLTMRLESLPGAWVPRDVDGWLAFSDLVKEVDFATGLCAGADIPALLNAGGDWRGYRDRVVRAAGMRDIEAAHRVMDGIDDVCRSYVRQVLDPLVAAHADAGHPHAPARGVDAVLDAGFALLFSGRSLTTMIEVSREWHAREARMRALVAIANDGAAKVPDWPPAYPEAWVGDVWVHVLTSELELLAEGSTGADDGIDGLGHCVGGYSERCLGGGCRILSLRRMSADGGWTRLSTAEVTNDFDHSEHAMGGDPGLDGIEVEVAGHTVVQHVGSGNSDPAEDARAALDAYLRHLASGTLPFDADAMEPIDPAEVTLASRCGYDWEDASTRAAVRGMWDAFLPRALRGIAEEELLGLIGGIASEGPGRRWLAVPGWRDAIEALPPTPSGPACR